MPVLLRNTFKVWIDRAPGALPRLIMVGDVRVPSNGWHARLIRRGRQGVDPRMLILDVNAEEPDGEVREETTTIPLRYEESPPQDDYGQVMIANGRGEIVVHICDCHERRSENRAAEALTVSSRSTHSSMSIVLVSK